MVVTYAIATTKNDKDHNPNPYESITSLNGSKALIDP
jgi:hypothetical protein